MNKYDDDFLMDPKVDFVFKKIFCDEKHPEILIGLLNAVLKLTNSDEIVSFEILNPSNDKNFIDDKHSILDIKAKTNSDSYINIEMQMNPTHMIPRTVYYLCKLITDQLHEKEPYKDILRSVCINILGRNIFPGEERFHNAYLFKEIQTNNVLTNLTEIHFIELQKLNSKQMQNEDFLRNWVLFLNNPQSSEVKMISNKVKEIEAAYNALKKISRDKDSRELYESKLKGIRDWVSAMDENYQEGEEIGIKKGEKIGIKKGKVEGEKQKAVDIAKKLLEQNFDISNIAKITDLSIAEIESIIQNNKKD